MIEFGGTIKSYKEVFEGEDCPERVTLKFIALKALINAQDAETFSVAYHFLTDTKSKKVLKPFFERIKQPLKRERRAYGNI